MLLWFLLGFVEVVRFIAPLFIFLNPVIVSIIAFSFDVLDGPIAIQLNFSWKKYNLLDKIMDNWWYLFIVLYMRQTPLYPVFILLWAYRIVGTLLVLKNHQESTYLYFPNILEWFFYIFLLFQLLNGLPTFYLLPVQIIIFATSVLISVLVEWSVHIEKKSRIATGLLGVKMNWKN